MSDDQHVIIEDEVLAQGFTQIPNQILRRSDVPPGAKLTYMVLLSYAWQKDRAYPGQDRLAEAMGVSERSVITYLKQLVDAGLISIRRRGLGLTNVYVIHRISRSEKSAPPAGSENIAVAEVKKPTAPEVQNLPVKKTQLKKTQLEEDPSNDSNDLNLMLSKEDAERIAWVVSDIAREFSDQAPAKSTASRALNLYAASGLDLTDYLDLLQAARVRTKRYTGNIKAERLPDGTKPKIGYFFSVLEDLLAS